MAGKIWIEGAAGSAGRFLIILGEVKMDDDKKITVNVNHKISFSWLDILFLAIIILLVFLD